MGRTTKQAELSRKKSRTRFQRQSFRLWGLAILIFGAVACVSDPPLDDYVLADAAMQAARSSRADQYAAGYWQKAQSAYVAAEALFKDREFDDAAQHFKRAREYAERAENSARLIQFRSGGAFP